MPDLSERVCLFELQLSAGGAPSAYRAETKIRLPQQSESRFPQSNVDLHLQELEGFQGKRDYDGYRRKLTESLFGGEGGYLKTAFSDARLIADYTETPLRVRIIIDPSARELHGIAWELLGDCGSTGSATSIPVPIATNQRRFLSRYLNPPLRRLRHSSGRLRCIMLVANPRLDHGTPLRVDNIDVDRQCQAAASQCVDSEESPGVVEPVHLQVVCDYLWGTCTHPVEALGELKKEKKLATVTSALAEYYKNTLKEVSGGDEDVEYRIRSWFENVLIESRERRNKVSIPHDSTEVSTSQLNFLKEKYLIRDDQPSAPASERVVELAHDRLIYPVIEQNREWFGKYRQAWWEAAEEYARKPAPHLLLTCDALQAAEDWARRNPVKSRPFQNFLEASREQEKRQALIRKLAIAARVWMAIGVIGLIAAVAAGIFVAGAVNRRRTALRSGGGGAHDGGKGHGHAGTGRG